MTTFECLVNLLAYCHLDRFERKLLSKFYSGLQGIGNDLTDEEVLDYLTPGQVDFIKRTARKRRLIKRGSL